MWGLRKASDVSSMAEVKEEVDRERHNESAIVEEDPLPGTAKATMNGVATGASADHTTGIADSNTAPDKPQDRTPPSALKEVSKPGQSHQEDTMKGVNGNPQANPKNASKKVTDDTSKMNGVHSRTTPLNKASHIPPKISTASENTALKPASKKSPVNAPPDLLRAIKAPITPTQKQPTIKGSPHKAAAVTASAKAAQEEQSSPEVSRKSNRPSLAHTSGTKASAAKTKPEPSKKNGTPKSPPSRIKPKSPTRPVRLPASATAQTASSAAKTGTSLSRSPSRASTTNPGLGRKPSTLKRERPVAKVPAGSTIAKKASRPSLGQTKEHDQPRSRSSTVSKSTDSSFLARMMRPTTSSAQKTHEKTDIKSPPRSKGKMPATRKESLKSERTHLTSENDRGGLEDQDLLSSQDKNVPLSTSSEEESQPPESTLGQHEFDNGAKADSELTEEAVGETLEAKPALDEGEDPAVDAAGQSSTEVAEPEPAIEQASEGISTVNNVDPHGQVPVAAKDDDTETPTTSAVAAKDTSGTHTPSLSGKSVHDDALSEDANGQVASDHRQEASPEGSNEMIEGLESEAHAEKEREGPDITLPESSKDENEEVSGADRPAKDDPLEREHPVEAALNSTDAVKEEPTAQ